MMLKRAKSLVSSDDVEVATDRRLGLVVLGVSLAATVLLFATNISQELTFVLALSLMLALILALRG